MTRRLPLLGLGDHPVDVPRGDPPVVLLDGALQHGAQLVDALAGEGRDLQHRGVAHEVQLALELPGDVGTLLGVVQQFPLVQHHDDRAAGGVHPLRQALVLRRDALGGVDHQEGDVRIVDRPQGTDHRVVLGGVVDAAAAAHAGGVHEHDRPIGRVHQRVDGVPGGAGHVVHHAAVLAHQPVEQGALAHVGATDDGHTWRGHVVRAPQLLALIVQGNPVGGGHGLAPRTLRELGDHHVQQVAGPTAVQRADRHGLAHPEPQELPHLVLAAVVVRLVGHHHDGSVDAAQPVGDGFVVVGETDAGIHHEQHHVGGLHRGLHLAADLLVQLAASRQPATGVHQQEMGAQPLRLDLLAVAGDAGAVLHDGHLMADDAVEQGALANVGAADDDDGGQGVGGPRVGRGAGGLVHLDGSGADGAAAPSACRRAMPSVGTTSTGRGSASTLPPSRNRPSLRHTSGSR